MNRSVMDRQMFKKGGVAGFPDLSGDGQVTQKDILMGRGVIKMQDGGMAPMPAQMPAGPGPEVMAGGIGGIDPNSVDINQAAQGAMQQGIDPAVLEGMLGQYASQMDDLENAEDYEQVMNGIRGDDRPIEQRYQELAGLVGQEDAQQTPESVLALVQPVMMLAAVDQGIGGLAMEEMAAPVEGAMAEGIMSTVNMGQEEPAPANFNQGGPVIAMQEGGSPVGGRLGEIYRDKQALYQSILSPQSQQQAFEDQKQMTQAQMLFDIAQGALMFATPGERRMSPAERLAQSFTPVLGNISARAGELQQFKQGQEKEQRALNLQALGSAESTLAAEQDAAARAALQREANEFAASESRLERAHDITLKNMEFDFKKSETMSAQDFERELLDLRHLNNVALLGLEQDNSIEAMQIKNRLQQDNMRLGSQLRLAEMKVDFENTLKRDGILNGYELNRMERGHDFNVALADHNAAIAAQAQQVQNDFNAAQAVLDRALRENLQLSDQEFRAMLQEDMQSYNASQADIDRAIAKTNRAFDEALALRGEERADSQLTLQERAQTLDEMYKLGMLAVEQAAQNAIKLGSESKTNQLTYLTDAERLRKYANDELGDETALFEQALADYTKESFTWDGKSYTKTAAPVLARQIQAALASRVENGFEIPQIAGYNASSSKGSSGKPLDDSADVKPSLNSPEFKQSIFSPDMGINYDSPLWEDVPLNIIDKDIAYYRATGPSQVGQRISNVVSEYGRELFGLPPMSEEGRELVTATKDINNLREVINQELVNWSDDRVLKTTQDALRALAQDLTPGVFKFDESAAATLQSLKGNMGRAFQYYASMDPEYTPEAQNRFTETQVTNARARTSQIQSLLAEVIALEKIYTGYLESLTPGGPQGNVGGVGSARSMIRSMVNGGQQ